MSLASLPIPLEFVLFGLTLVGIALFHMYTLQVALTGLAAVMVYKLLFNSAVGCTQQPVPASAGSGCFAYAR